MGFFRFLLVVTIFSFCQIPPQKSSAIATIEKSHSSLGMCTDGIFAIVREEGSPSRPTGSTSVQDLVIHADDAPAQEYLRSADQWDYG